MLSLFMKAPSGLNDLLRYDRFYMPCSQDDLEPNFDYTLFLSRFQRLPINPI